MKTQVKLRALVIAKEEVPSRDGKTTYLRASIAQGAQAGTVSVHSDAFDKMIPFMMNDLDGEISEYEGKLSFKIMNASVVPNSNVMPAQAQEKTK